MAKELRPWIHQFGLCEWRIWVKAVPKKYLRRSSKTRAVVAEATSHDELREARIDVAVKNSRKRMRKVLPHELLHIACADIRAAQRRASAMVRPTNPELAAYMDDEAQDGEEHFVRRIERAFSEKG